MTELRQIAAGDRVAFSSAFLKDTLQHTGWRAFARGVVVKLDRVGGIVLATIKWDPARRGDPRVPGDPTTVATGNLIHEDRIPFEGR